MALFVAQTVSLRLFGHNLTVCATLCSNLSYIRQFKNRQKTDKNQAEQRLPFFFFFTFKKTDKNNP